MPKRRLPLIQSQIYHIFNRGVDHQPIFFHSTDYQRCLRLLDYYRLQNQPLPYSKYIRLPADTQIQSNNHPQISIIAFALMPNHYHLLLRQESPNGIERFQAMWQDSYAKYINKKHSRSGSLFQGRFKGVLVETELQLFHLSRYIHLNPLSSHIVKNIEDNNYYPWSSVGRYLSTTSSPTVSVEPQIILNQFNSNPNHPTSYRSYLKNRSKYQQSLETIKHLLLE